jgi:hypothetical protein
LVFQYQADRRGRRLDRGLRVRVGSAGHDVKCWDRCLRFPLSLPPRGTWQVDLRFDSFVDGVWRTPFDIDERSERDRMRDGWRARRCQVIASAPAPVAHGRPRGRRSVFTPVLGTGLRRARAIEPRSMSGPTSAACQPAVNASRPKSPVYVGRPATGTHVRFTTGSRSRAPPRC